MIKNKYIWWTLKLRGGDNFDYFKLEGLCEKRAVATCRLSRSSGASASGNPKGPSRPVAGKLYLYFIKRDVRFSVTPIEVLECFYPPKMEAVRSSNTSVSVLSRHSIPDEWNLFLTPIKFVASVWGFSLIQGPSWCQKRAWVKPPAKWATCRRTAV
jgi:hypothetical protein